MTSSSTPGNQPNPTSEKTKAPKSEAQSAKPTFGKGAEKPVEAEKPAPAVSSKEASDHTAPDHVKDNLQSQQDRQASQLNPDQHQRDIHQSTTQDVLAPPVSRPHTLDPSTGQVHYVGVKAELKPGADKMSADPE